MLSLNKEKKEETSKKKMTVEDVKERISDWSDFFEVFQDEKDLNDLQKDINRYKKGAN